MKLHLQRHLSIATLALFVACLSAATVLTADAATATGTWKWSTAGQNGQTFETTLKLKQDGTKLTGAVVRRDTETAIEAGQIEDNNLSFKVTRERNGRTFTMAYKGKLSGDTIKGTTEFERNGQTQSRDWEAKRVGPPADPTGTWKWTFTPANGQPRESTLKLKFADGKLTGTLLGRSGNEIAIENGKFEGNEVSFAITRERNSRTFTSKYSGKLTGDVIKGEIAMSGGNQTNPREWEAKREKTVDVTGTWQWTMERNGQTIERQVKLKQDGEKLTGVSIFGNNEVEIEQGQIQGNEVSFQVTRERDGNKMVIKYHGKVEGDSLTGKIEGNFGGQDQSFDWEAKRK